MMTYAPIRVVTGRSPSRMGAYAPIRVVPKPPSLRPKQRRSAMNVQGGLRPSGTIPRTNYSYLYLATTSYT